MIKQFLKYEFGLKLIPYLLNIYKLSFYASDHIDTSVSLLKQKYSLNVIFPQKDFVKINYGKNWHNPYKEKRSPTLTR